MIRRGPLFYVCRAVLRLKNLGWRTEVEHFSTPCVYICSHKNMAGPLTTLAQLPFPVRPWILYVFFTWKDCCRQYAGYTFSQRLGLPRWLALLCGAASAALVSPLVRSAGGIPVYRGSVRAAATFRETVASLEAGDPVILYPDVDYTNTEEGIGEVYDGFLLIERFWRRRHDQPLLFVPILMERTEKRLRSGHPVQFDRSLPFAQEQIRVREELRRQINEGV